MPRASRIRLERSPLTGRREEPLRPRRAKRGEELPLTVDFSAPEGMPKPTFRRDDRNRLWVINPHANVPMKLYAPDGSGGMNRTNLEPNMPFTVSRGSEVRWQHEGKERYVPIYDHGVDSKGHWFETIGKDKPIERHSVPSLGSSLQPTTPPVTTPRPSFEPMEAPPAPWASATPHTPPELVGGGRVLLHPIHTFIDPHHAHFFVSGGNLNIASTGGEVRHSEVGHTAKPLAPGQVVKLNEQDTIGIGPNVFKVKEGNQLEIVQGPGKGKVIDVASQPERYFSIGSALDNHLILATGQVEPQAPRKKPVDLAQPVSPPPLPSRPSTPPWAREANPPGGAEVSHVTPVKGGKVTAKEIPLAIKGVGEPPAEKSPETEADVHGKAGGYGGTESGEFPIPAAPARGPRSVDQFAKTGVFEIAPPTRGAPAKPALQFPRGEQQLFEHEENKGIADVHARINLSGPTGQGARLFADDLVLVKGPAGKFVGKKNSKIPIALRRGTVFQIGQNVFEVKTADQGAIILAGVDGPVKGRTFPLEGKEVSIGSGANADLVLATPQEEIVEAQGRALSAEEFAREEEAARRAASAIGAAVGEAFERASRRAAGAEKLEDLFTVTNDGRLEVVPGAKVYIKSPGTTRFTATIPPQNVAAIGTALIPGTEVKAGQYVLRVEKPREGEKHFRLRVISGPGKGQAIEIRRPAAPAVGKPLSTQEPAARTGFLDVLARRAASLLGMREPEAPIQTVREVPLRPAPKAAELREIVRTVIEHPDNSNIAPLHAVFQVSQSGTTVFDNESEEGVYVKGRQGGFKRIKPSGRVQLRSGHYIRLGKNIFLVQSDGRRTGQLELVGVAGPAKGQEFAAPFGQVRVGSHETNQLILKAPLGQQPVRRGAVLVTPYEPPAEVPPEGRVSITPKRVVGKPAEPPEAEEDVIEAEIGKPGEYARWAQGKERAAREKRAARARLLGVLKRRAGNLRAGEAQPRPAGERVSITPPARVVGTGPEQPQTGEDDDSRSTLVTLAPIKEPELGEDEVVFRDAEHLRELLKRHMVLYNAVRTALQTGKIQESKVQSVDSMVRNAAQHLDQNARDQLVLAAMKAMTTATPGKHETAALKHIETQLAQLLRDKPRSAK